MHRRTLTWIASLAACAAVVAVCVLLYSAWSPPTVTVDVPTGPITINLNVKTAAELRDPCALLGVVEGEGECLHIEEIVAGLKKAPLSYNRVTEMVRGERTPLALIVDLSGQADAEEEFTGLDGQLVTAETEVTRHMSAELSGSAFDIEPKGAHRKLITSVAPTRWDWTVTPIEQGKGKLLLLQVFVHIERNGEVSPPITIDTFRDLIAVEVTAWDRVTDVVAAVNPVYAFGVAVITGISGLYTWWRRKRST